MLGLPTIRQQFANSPKALPVTRCPIGLSAPSY
jgi:hypothetical protein